jgi:phenylacetate-CoA ligase
MSFYGHSEKAVCAYQNQDGNMEFHPLYGYTEFLDEKGCLAADDEDYAYVVATSFDNTYFPFIRYETDDRIDGLCGGMPMIAERIVGRKQEFVYDRYGNRLPFTCNDEVISDVRGIRAYQYVQNEMGKLELHLQVDGAFDHGSIAEIRSRSEEIFMNCTISIKIVNEIEKTPSGKFRYLIQNIVW